MREPHSLQKLRRTLRSESKAYARPICKRQEPYAFPLRNRLLHKNSLLKT